MNEMDLVIRHGELVTADGSVGRVNVGIRQGLIAQIGGMMSGKEEIDAAGRLLFPGGIDAHVHLTVPPDEADADFTWVDDFSSGSAAALAGGITTLGNMTFPDMEEAPLESLRRETTVAQQQSIADFFLHPVLWDMSPQVLADVPKLLQAGCNSIKIFTTAPAFDQQQEAYINAIQQAGSGGLISLIHCEDRSLIRDATARLLAAGHSALRYYPLSRPIVAEVVATQRAVAIAEATGAPIYVVHLSSKRALEVCAEAQARGVPVYVETRPLYLHLTSERFNDPDGAKYVGQPPLREVQDVQALWSGIAQGTIHTVCTDHAPWSLAAKLDPSHHIGNLRPGVANLQTMLPMLYSEGVRGGRISLARFVQVTSTNAAKLFGLYPGKGSITVGADADLVIFDPNLERTINKAMLKSNSDFSAFEGWRVTGWPEVTIRRGEVVFKEGEVLGRPGSGRLLIRQAMRQL
ncbi:MAG: amidohydrolase family protein [Candidatus Promineifilaceae bacterium]|nr:amidohydrolase family protein [Candidatus Promineifilaceae bacterium]